MKNLLTSMNPILRQSGSVFCPLCRRLENNVVPVLTRLLINQQWRNLHVSQLCWSESCKGKDELRACMRDIVQTDKLTKWWIRENREVIQENAVSEQSLLKQASVWLRTNSFNALEEYTMYSTLTQMELASRFDPNLVDNQFTPYVTRYEKGHVMLETRTLSTLQQCFLSNALLHSSVCQTSAGGCCSSIELAILAHSWDLTTTVEATDNEGLFAMIAMDTLFQPNYAERASDLLNGDGSSSSREDAEDDVPRMGEEDHVGMDMENAPRMDMDDIPRMDMDDIPRMEEEDAPIPLPVPRGDDTDTQSDESDSMELSIPLSIPTLFRFISENYSAPKGSDLFTSHYDAMDKETADDFDTSNVPSGILAMHALAKSRPYITTVINSLTNLEFTLTHSPLTPETANMDPLIRGLFLMTTRLLELIGSMPKYEDIRRRLEALKTFALEHPKEDQNHNESQMMEMICILTDYLRIYNPPYLSNLSLVFRMIEPFQLLMQRLMGFIPVELSADRRTSYRLSCRCDVERPLLRLCNPLQSRVLLEGDLRLPSDSSHRHRAVAHRPQFHSRLRFAVS